MSRSSSRIALVGVVVTSALAGAACGGTDPAVPSGLALARSKGCTSCHGATGDGGIAPTWRAIAGEPVDLDDGTTVVRDRDYLVRALIDPTAEKVAGYTLTMPSVALTDEEVTTLVAFLEGYE